MGFLLLFLFAALNVALGWATANWLARRQEFADPAMHPAEQAAIVQADAVEQTPVSVPAEPQLEAAPAVVEQSPVVNEQPPATAAAAPPAEEPPQDQSIIDEYDGPKEETGQLGFADVIDRVAEECELTKAISGVLKLEIEQFRTALLTAETVYRTADADDDDALVAAFQDVKAAIDGWIPDQVSACEQMEAAKSKHDIFTALGLPIDDILRLATGRLETRCRRMQAEEEATSENAGKVRREIVGLIDACHDLRDAIQIGFASVAKTNQKFQYGEGLQIDEVTGLANYAGLEAAIGKWWTTEDRTGDAASLIVIDADGMAQLNQQLGTVQSDQLLREIGITLRHGLRQERGFDVPARVSGQRFAALVGYTTPRQAANAMERIRQMIDATQFTGEQASGDNETCKVRVSCAITSLQKNVSLEKHLGCLTETLEFAKERGGNCTAIWHDNEITHVEPIEYEVEEKQVTLTADVPNGEVSASPEEEAAPQTAAADVAAEDAQTPEVPEAQSASVQEEISPVDGNNSQSAEEPVSGDEAQPGDEATGEAAGESAESSNNADIETATGVPVAEEPVEEENATDVVEPANTEPAAAVEEAKDAPSEITAAEAAMLAEITGLTDEIQSVTQSTSDADSSADGNPAAEEDAATEEDAAADNTAAEGDAVSDGETTAEVELVAEESANRPPTVAESAEIQSAEFAPDAGEEHAVTAEVDEAGQAVAESPAEESQPLPAGQ